MVTRGLELSMDTSRASTPPPARASGPAGAASVASGSSGASAASGSSARTGHRRVRARPADDRASRRARLEGRVVHGVPPDAPDPILHDDPGAVRSASRGTVILIVAAALHALVLLGFVFGNQLYQALTAEPPAETEPLPVAVVDEPEPSPSARPSEPPEPADEPLPAEALEATEAVSDPTPAPLVGISADSLAEGGDGPAYQVGASLAGATGSGDVAQQVLGADKARASSGDDLVMTQDAVDALPAPVDGNRPPAVSARARRDGVSGFVQVQFLITRSGAVEDLQILRAEPAGVFDQSVLDTVPAWRFTPATYQGKPVTMRIRQTIRFDVS